MKMTRVTTGAGREPLARHSPAAESVPSAAIVVIGNEVLAAQVEENNAVFLARELARLGSRVERILVIPDDEEVIAAEIASLAARFDAVLVTGGLGVTHDDVTRQALARAFSLPLRADRRALAMIRRWYGVRRLSLWRRKLADLPHPCRLVANPAGSAPGFVVGNVYVFPGVPVMLRAMFPLVAGEFAGPALLRREIFTTLSETVFAGRLGRLAAAFPGVEIGSYPLPVGHAHKVKLALASLDSSALETAASRTRTMLARLGDPGAAAT